MTRLQDLPARAILVQEYAQLDEYVLRFTNGEFNLLVVVGEAFDSKSRVVKQSVRGRALWLDAAGEPADLYRDLHEHRRKPVVFDNVDVFCTEQKCLPLVRSFCSGEVVKILKRPEGAAGREVPSEFETTFPAMILADGWYSLLENVPSLESGGELLFFNPSGKEYFDQVYLYEQDPRARDF